MKYPKVIVVFATLWFMCAARSVFGDDESAYFESDRNPWFMNMDRDLIQPVMPPQKQQPEIEQPPVGPGYQMMPASYIPNYSGVDPRTSMLIGPMEQMEGLSQYMQANMQPNGAQNMPPNMGMIMQSPSASLMSHDITQAEMDNIARHQALLLQSLHKPMEPNEMPHPMQFSLRPGRDSVRRDSKPQVILDDENVDDVFELHPAVRVQQADGLSKRNVDERLQQQQLQQQQLQQQQIQQQQQQLQQQQLQQQQQQQQQLQQQTLDTLKEQTNKDVSNVLFSPIRQDQPSNLKPLQGTLDNSEDNKK